MPDSCNSRLGPDAASKRWVEVDRRYWQDPRSGRLWDVIAWSEIDIPLSEARPERNDETSVLLVFDAFHLQYVVRWTDPKPLVELSQEELRGLLSKAKKHLRH